MESGRIKSSREGQFDKSKSWTWSPDDGEEGAPRFRNAVQRFQGRVVFPSILSQYGSFPKKREPQGRPTIL